MINLIKNFDNQIFTIINQALNFPALNQAFIFISSIECSYLAVVLALVLFLLRKKYHTFSALLLLAAAELNWFIGGLIKDLVNRPRPPQCNLEGINLLIDCAQGLSFPSGHTLAAFSLATVLALRYPKSRIPVFLAASLIGYSRVYVGVHFPFDVLGGAVIAILSTYFLVKIFEVDNAK